MAMDVTLRQLSAFLAVLEAGSFSEASREMHVSQAALSGLVKALEDRVGVRLLNRNTRNVGPTVVGEAFEPLARRVLEARDEALNGLTNLKDLQRGVVRVAAPEPLSCTLLPELIAVYGERHPGVDVRFEDVSIERVVEGLQNGSTDIGFGTDAPGVEEPLEVHTMWADSLAVALRADDPLAQGGPVTWKDLGDRLVISYMPDLATHVLSNVPRRLHPARVERVQRVNTALAMLKVKRGAVLCPEIAEPLVHGFGLKFVALQRPEVRRNIAMLVSRRLSLSPAVQSFLDFTLEFAQTWATMSAQARRMDGASRARK